MKPARSSGMMNEFTRAGGCACGAIRFTAHGPPKRVGLCHCLTCRKAHAAAFNPFVVYSRNAVDVDGTPRTWSSSPGYARAFCEVCGSRIFGEIAGEIEISLGSFDQVGEDTPQYESWTVRREPWLPALPIPQYARGRDG